MAIWESRSIKDKLSPIYMNLLNYSYELFPAEANAGGTLIYIYIKNRGSYKTRNNINVNAFFEL